MEKYNHKEIEKKWQKKWADEDLYKVSDNQDKPKYYILDMFPYPSGAGLHVGHPKGYIATDVFARLKMMQGFNVLHPMGWDAFGLPTENYALQNKVHPRAATEKNIKIFKDQLKKLGFTYDWSREINTTDPEFYKWTQWTFIKMFERGLAYESYEPINWCPSCKTGLANEDLENGKCERCGSEVEQKPMRQWVLKITDYADRLLNDLEKLPDWEESIKEMQRNWIGRSEGATVKFPITNHQDTNNNQSPNSNNQNEYLEVFTTRPDTLFGCTYMVVAPEHPLITNWQLRITNYDEVEKYIKRAGKKTEMERTELAKEKTGVKIEGVVAINPVNNEEVPIYVADYVMMGYGTGAIMAVPAHDERDFEFAKKYGIEIKEVVVPDSAGESQNSKLQLKTQNCNSKLKTIEVGAFCGSGTNVNSEFLNGLATDKAKEKMIKWLEDKELGKRAVNYKLKDWVFSRQRYWGEPIPIVHCEKCKSKKYKYILLHGRHGSSKKDFFPWLKKSLEDLGHEVCCPDLPNTEDPKVAEQADFVINNTEVNSDTIIVGHSLGSAVALNILEKVNKKVARVVLVDSLIYPKFNDKARPDLERNFDWKFNFEKIKKLSIEFIDLADNNFPIIPKKQFIEKNELLNTRLLYIKTNNNHFNSEIEPSVLKHSLMDGIYSVPESELPIKLPEVKHYEPTGTGESPLANIADWVNTTCPKCGGPAKRETNTMPQWAGSSWYYLRYIDPHNDKALVDKAKEKYWSPIDFYVGGAEHATRHLIYARFWHKFLYDIGAVNYEEPFTRLQHVGLISAEDGRKMSKRWGNVINPDEVVEKYGADAMRVYEMFMGPFSQAVAWNTNGLIGARRFLEKAVKLKEKITNYEPSNSAGRLRITNKKIEGLLHKTIKKAGSDIEEFKLNTAVSAMMILVNEMEKEKEIDKNVYEKFLLILSPFAPHLTEEIWLELGHKESIFKEKWPEYDPELARDEKVELVLQVNGKLRDTIMVDADIDEAEAKKIALENEKIKKWLEGKKVVKVIFVKGKLVNIVVK